MKKQFLVLFFIMSLISCSNEKIEVLMDAQIDISPLAYKEIMNITYGNDSNQTYDIYLPEGRNENTKTMIMVHGGGWSSGDKSSMDPLIELYLIDFPNIALVNINYRLSTENNPPYPMQINDITSIVNQLKAKKADFVISEDYGFLGVSAGGHLALLWSYAFDLQNNVEMVCSVVGPTNFTDPAYINNTNPILNELLNAYGINPTTEFLEEISPLHRAETNSPPTILFYGGLDPLIPITQGMDLNTKLDQLGVLNEYILYPNEGHGWVGTELLDTWFKLKTFTQANFMN